MKRLVTAVVAVVVGASAYAGTFDSPEYYGAVLRDIQWSKSPATAVQPGMGDTYGQAARKSPSAPSSDGMRGKNPELDGSVLYDVGHNI